MRAELAKVRPLALAAGFGVALAMLACGSDSDGGSPSISEDAAAGRDGSVGSGGSAATGGTAAGGTNPGGSAGAGGGGQGGTGMGGGGQAGSVGQSGSGGSPDGGPSGWPDADNTGIPPGACAGGLEAAVAADLRPSSGAVVQCMRFTDELPYVGQTVSRVTFKYCRFEVSSTSPDAFVNVQGADVSFEDSEFAGGVETWIRTSYEGNRLAVRRSDFSGMANAVEFGTTGVVIEDNFVHDFATVTQAQHADGIQTDGASGAVVRHNTVLLNAVAGATAAIGIWASLGNLDDVLVENNLVAGGGYTVYPGVRSGGRTANNVRFVGNRFSTRFHDNCGQFGPKYPNNLPPALVWTDNHWYDGARAGQPIE